MTERKDARLELRGAVARFRAKLRDAVADKALDGKNLAYDPSNGPSRSSCAID